MRIHKCCPGFTVTCDNVHDTRRNARLGANLGKDHRRERGVFRRFQHHRVAHRQGRGNFPGQHEQREIPRDDLATDTQRLAVGQFGFHQLGKTGVVIEMPDRQGHINIAAFADRFAVVERLHHRQKAAVFLHQTRDGIKNAGAPVARFGPGRLRFAGGGDGCVDFRCRAFGDTRQLFAGSRVVGREVIPQWPPFAVDIMARDSATVGQPFQRLSIAFRGGAVFHSVEDFLDGHGLSNRVPPGGGIGPGDVMFELPFDIAQQG